MPKLEKTDTISTTDSTDATSSKSGSSKSGSRRFLVSESTEQHRKELKQQYRKDHEERVKNAGIRRQNADRKIQDLDRSFMHELIHDHRNIEQETETHYEYERGSLLREAAIENQEAIDHSYKAKGKVQNDALGARLHEIEIEGDNKENRTWKPWGKQQKIAAFRQTLEGQYRRMRDQIKLGDSENYRKLGQPSSSMDGVKDYSLGDLSHLTREDVQQYADKLSEQEKRTVSFDEASERLLEDHKQSQELLHRERKLRTGREKIEMELRKLEYEKGTLQKLGKPTTSIEEEIGQKNDEKDDLAEDHDNVKEEIKELEKTAFGELANKLRKKEIAGKSGLTAEDITDKRGGMITVFDNPEWKDNTPTQLKKRSKLSDSMEQYDETLGPKKGGKEIRRARKALIDEFQAEMDAHGNDSGETIKAFGEAFHDLNQKGLLYHREKTDNMRRKEMEVDKDITRCDSRRDDFKYAAKDIKREWGETDSNWTKSWLALKYSGTKAIQGVVFMHRSRLQRWNKSRLESKIGDRQKIYDEAKKKFYKSPTEELEGHEGLLRFLKDKKLFEGFADLPEAPEHGSKSEFSLKVSKGYRISEEVDDLTHESTDSRTRREARRNIRMLRKAWGKTEMQEHRLRTEWDKVDAAYRAARTEAFDILKSLNTEKEAIEAIRDNPELRRTMRAMDGHRKRIQELSQETEEVKSGYGHLESRYNEMRGRRMSIPNLSGGYPREAAGSPEGNRGEAAGSPEGNRGEAAESPEGNRGEAAETGPRAGNVLDRVTSNTEGKTGPKKGTKEPGFFEKFLGAIDGALGEVESSIFEAMKRDGTESSSLL